MACRINLSSLPWLLRLSQFSLCTLSPTTLSSADHATVTELPISSFRNVPGSFLCQGLHAWCSLYWELSSLKSPFGWLPFFYYVSAFLYPFLRYPLVSQSEIRFLPFFLAPSSQTTDHNLQLYVYRVYLYYNCLALVCEPHKGRGHIYFVYHWISMWDTGMVHNIYF